MTHNTTRYSIIYIQLFDYNIHILDATNFNHNANIYISSYLQTLISVTIDDP